MGAYLQISDRAAASDEYRRIKQSRKRHQAPNFKAEYQRRKQEERDEERRIRSLAKQNAEAAIFFQVIETETDLERCRATAISRYRSLV